MRHFGMQQNSETCGYTHEAMRRTAATAELPMLCSSTKKVVNLNCSPSLSSSAPNLVRVRPSCAMPNITNAAHTPTTRNASLKSIAAAILIASQRFAVSQPPAGAVLSDVQMTQALAAVRY